MVVEHPRWLDALAEQVVASHQQRLGLCPAEEVAVVGGIESHEKVEEAEAWHHAEAQAAVPVEEEVVEPWL